MIKKGKSTVYKIMEKGKLVYITSHGFECYQVKKRNGSKEENEVYIIAK